jgi:hypothetical protein
MESLPGFEVGEKVFITRHNKPKSLFLSSRKKDPILVGANAFGVTVLYPKEVNGAVTHHEIKRFLPWNEVKSLTSVNEQTESSEQSHAIG